jgi:prophage DNA circulation protein
MASRRAEARRVSRGNKAPYTRDAADTAALKNQDSTLKALNTYNKDTDNLRTQLQKVIKENKNLNDRIRVLENRASMIERVVNQIKPIVERFARIIK